MSLHLKLYDSSILPKGALVHIPSIPSRIVSNGEEKWYMVEAPAWLVYTFDLLIFVAIAFGLVFLRSWYNVRRFQGKHTMKMYAEVWEPSGRRPKHIIEPDTGGDTVTVNNIVYRLPKELSTEEQSKLRERKIHIYPRRCWVEVNNWPLPSIPVRVESWEMNNPEPIRPFYGRVDKDGKFVDSQLTVTGTEWQAQKSVIQATSIAMRVQEREAREKEWTKAMANLPNKLVVYLLLGVAAIGSVVCLIILYQG